MRIRRMRQHVHNIIIDLLNIVATESFSLLIKRQMCVIYDKATDVCILIIYMLYVSTIFTKISYYYYVAIGGHFLNS